jgi:hypothetical protein
MIGRVAGRPLLRPVTPRPWRCSRARILVAGIGLSIAPGLGGPGLAAQTVEAIRIEDGNGQFAFWLPEPRRPDHDLTNRASVALVFDGSMLWRHLLGSRPIGCAALTYSASTGSPDANRRCSATEVYLGQDMYTPPASATTSMPQPGQRPYAGWLFVSGTARLANRTQSDAVTLEMGVTGDPSLAEKVQTAWHTLIGYPRPLGWAHQIPFQAGVLVGYEHRQEVLRATVGDVPVLSVVPVVGATAGNVLTGLSAGVDAHLGYGVRPPWASEVGGAARSPELYLLSGIRENLVAYDLFLDSGTRDPTRRVTKRPLNTQYEFGLGARWRPIELEYRAITRTQDYTTGRTVQPSGTLVLGLRFHW